IWLELLFIAVGCCSTPCAVLTIKYGVNRRGHIRYLFFHNSFGFTPTFINQLKIPVFFSIKPCLYKILDQAREGGVLSFRHQTQPPQERAWKQQGCSHSIHIQ